MIYISLYEMWSNVVAKEIRCRQDVGRDVVLRSLMYCEPFYFTYEIIQLHFNLGSQQFTNIFV
jgi:hypothetical protein